VTHSGTALRSETTMSEDLAYGGAAQDSFFTVHAEPPWLLHLAGELDMAGAPALTRALEAQARSGGTIGLDLAELTFMDSTGIKAICDAAQLLGERGRIVVFRPPPQIRRVIEICGLAGVIDVNDDPSPPHVLD
jgi:stage II sporulation protein AA (anti-sigma F factor antagonist)